MKRVRTFAIACIFVFLTQSSFGSPLDVTLSLNVKDSPLRGVLEMIAARSSLRLAMEYDPASTLSFARSNISAREALDLISRDQSIEYTLSGNTLIITKRGLTPSTRGKSEARLIPIRYGTASEISAKVMPTLSSDERLMVDDRSNNLVYMGSERGYARLVNLVTLFDAAPTQVAIEAQIVETSNQFLRDIGVSMGDLSDRTLGNNSKISGFTSTSQPNVPNISLKALLGKLDGRALDLRISAAETNGDAKVISRPKVVTLNNRQARIESGISYNIKTLSSVPTGGANGGSQGTATGGVTTVDAGLSLDIMPTIVGDRLIRMLVNINNSQPDEGSSVDGIPGVLKNSANTSVIVADGQTAIIAGLVKQSKSNSSSGVPILSDIPVLGYFFKSHSKTDRNNELVIFITPSIIDGEIHLSPSAKAVTRAPATDKSAP